MTRPTLFLFNFILFAFLILQVQSSLRNTLSNAFASQDGQVPIRKDSYGFYVEVDYKSNATSSSDTGKAILSTMTHKTTMFGNCLGFNSYICSSPNCNLTTGSNSEILYPFFTTKASPAQMELYLDHKEWQVNSNGFYSTDCKAASEKNFGAGRVGIVGLGIENGSDKNFKSYQGNGTLFSIKMNKNLTGGLLYFREEPSIVSALPKNLTLPLKSGSSWRTETNSWTLSLSNSTGISANASIVFDVHADGIELPRALYSWMISYFKGIGVNCSDSNQKPDCFYDNGTISYLPTVTLKLSNNGPKISIPPELYLQDPVTPIQHQIGLNFKESDTQSYFPEYKTQARDTILFDSRFMSYYYVVFKKEGVVIYGPNEPSTGSTFPWLIVGIIAVAVVGVAGGASAFMRKKKPVSLSQQSLEIPTLKSSYPV